MKNHLFIGLGGQGGKSVAELKKVFEQRSSDVSSLGNKGHQWDFLYIDSSRDVSNNRENWTHFGKSLHLENDSFLYLKDEGGHLDAQKLALQPDVAPWIGEVKRLDKFLEGAKEFRGANQRRRFGRLLFASKADRILKAICDDKVAPMTSNGNQCAFHIFASLAGGTGSGSIVDLVTLLRTRYPSSDIDGGFPIFLYLYVTSDDFEKDQVGYFHQNQYAALRDLNALACGRFRPTLVGSSYGGAQFAGNDPITQIILSTSWNGRNKRLELSKQHQIVAEAAFERIFAYCNGDLDEGSQRPLTGEDILPNYPGEPLGNLLRSFRFGSSGMRRWEVPTEEIHEMLANDLYVSVFREMLYQHWNEDQGYLNARLSLSRSGATELGQSLFTLLNAASIEKKELSRLNDALSADLVATHSGLKRQGFKDKDLGDYETALRERFTSHLNAVGLEETFSAYREQRDTRLKDLSRLIEETITAAWARIQSPIGLAYIPDGLSELQENLRKRLANAEEADESSDNALRSRMEVRKGEWQKMTALSRPIKQNALAEAHRKDLQYLLQGQLRNRIVSEDIATLEETIKELGSLEARFRDSVINVESWLNKKTNRRDTLQRDLLNLQKDDVANKSEISAVDFESFLRIFRTKRSHLVNTAESLRQTVIIPALSGDALSSLSRIEDARAVIFWEKADEEIFRRALQIHNEIVEKNGLKPILTSDLLETLKKRYDKDPEEFKKELKLFIDSATASAQIDNSQFQPKVLRGDENMPFMPRKVLVLGLPRLHSFSATLQSLIKPLLPAGDNTAQGVYFHEDPTQIRLLFVASWMAARFASVVKELENKYSKALSANLEGDTTYFTNIDGSGEKGQRPALLLPSPEESRSIMRAALWLGRRIPADDDGTFLISESDGRVALIQNSDSGIVPYKLGSSIEEVKTSADILSISKVSDAVSAALVSIDSELLESMKEQVKAEDKAKREQHGASSSEYADWTNDRQKIYELLGK